MAGSSVANALASPSHRLRWMWHELPASSVWGLAMNVTLTPIWSASSFMPCFMIEWRSAMVSTSA